MRVQMQAAFYVTTCLLLAATASSAGDKKTPDYYPLQVGNSWSFRVKVGDQEGVVVSRVARIDKDADGKPLAVLEAESNGKVVASEHLRQTADGIFRYRNNGVEISPPLCLLKFPVKSGDKWDGPINSGKEKGTFAAEAKEEDVEVPAGKFKAIKVSIRLESMGQVVNTAYWFVADTGFVKQTVQTPKLSITMDLTKFERKKK
jgi:hypothetical protein